MVIKIPQCMLDKVGIKSNDDIDFHLENDAIIIKKKSDNDLVKTYENGLEEMEQDYLRKVYKNNVNIILEEINNLGDNNDDNRI